MNIAMKVALTLDHVFSICIKPMLVILMFMGIILANNLINLTGVIYIGM